MSGQLIIIILLSAVAGIGFANLIAYFIFGK